MSALGRARHRIAMRGWLGRGEMWKALDRDHRARQAQRNRSAPQLALAAPASRPIDTTPAREIRDWRKRPRDRRRGRARSRAFRNR